MIAVRGLTLFASPLAWRCGLVLLAAGIVVRELAAPSPVQGVPAPECSGRSAALRHGRACPDHPRLSWTAESRGWSASADHDDRSPRATTTYPAIAQHPLFVPTRRPWIAPPAPPAPAAAAPAPPASFTVIGTVIGSGIRRAIVRPPNGDRTIVLREGQSLQGWTLRRIGRERLRFENNGASYELRFPPPAPGQVTQAGR